MKTPSKLTEAIHIDDFKKFERTVEKRLSDLETGQGEQESTMKELKDGVSTINKAIMGDIANPDKPGMAEQMRTVSGDVKQLVEIHQREAASALKEKQAPSKDSSFFQDLPWKVIIMALGVIGGLVTIIIKLIPLLQGAGG